MWDANTEEVSDGQKLNPTGQPLETGEQYTKKRVRKCETYGLFLNVIPDGFEPSALGLKVRCSTAELRDRHFLFFGEHKNTGFFCFGKMKSSVEVISRPKNLENNPRDIPLGFVIL